MKNIFIIENKLGDVEIIERLLSEEPDYHIEATDNIDDAIAKLTDNNHFDLILLDLNADGLLANNSYEVLFGENIINLPPIVILTNRESTDLALGLIQHGAQDYIVKSTISKSSFIKTINYALERHKLNTKLRFYIKEVEKSNKELENFAYVASHDLQEPLRKIITFSDKLNKFSDTFPVQANEYISRMQSAAMRMQDLLRDLLEYSRVDSKEHNFSEVDLNAIMAEVLTNLEDVILESGAQLEIDTLPRIQAVETQMLQLFQNLVSNAIKYRKLDTTPQIKIQTSSNEKNYIITFTDNGIGFEQEQTKKIFEQFYRLHNTNSPYKGTGIGLAICRRIVDKHNGEISATSETGIGSVFTLSLPIQQSSISKKLAQAVWE